MQRRTEKSDVRSTTADPRLSAQAGSITAHCVAGKAGEQGRRYYHSKQIFLNIFVINTACFPRNHTTVTTEPFSGLAHTVAHCGNFASFRSACPSSGKPASSLPQFSVSLRVVPSGRGWWGPAVHNVCFSLRLPLHSTAPAWLWRVAKL